MLLVDVAVLDELVDEIESVNRRHSHLAEGEASREVEGLSDAPTSLQPVIGVKARVRVAHRHKL